MLLGLALVSLNFQGYMEVIVVYMFCFFKRRGKKKLILKNLDAHRVRNRRTALMYSFSLGFVMFLMSSYNMQMKADYYEFADKRGADMRLGMWTNSSWIDGISNFDKLLYDSPDIGLKSWSWASSDLSFILRRNYKEVTIGTFGQIK